MDKKISFVVVSWFTAAYLALIISLVALFYISTTKMVRVQTQDFRLYAALPQKNFESEDKIGFTDARAKIVEDFFKDYKSLLADYSSIFVQVADKYALDFRLMPAIAMQESNGGKKIIKDSHNPFGYGIYGKLVIRFASWEESIERVGKALRADYLDQGLKTPVQIMAKYTPPSLSKGGAWANGVSSFMEELR